MKGRSDFPTGWSFNPASPSRRIATAGLAGAGVLLSLWALFAGADMTLVSRILFRTGWSLPILPHPLQHNPPEVILNLFAWSLSLFFLLQGDSTRWSTSPPLVIACGLLNVLLATGNLLFLAFQLILLPALNLLYAGWSLLAVLLFAAVQPELLAALQFLKRTARPRQNSVRSCGWRRTAESPAGRD